MSNIYEQLLLGHQKLIARLLQFQEEEGVFIMWYDILFDENSTEIVDVADDGVDGVWVSGEAMRELYNLYGEMNSKLIFTDQIRNDVDDYFASYGEEAFPRRFTF